MKEKRAVSNHIFFWKSSDRLKKTMKVSHHNNKKHLPTLNRYDVLSSMNDPVKDKKHHMSV